MSPLGDAAALTFLIAVSVVMFLLLRRAVCLRMLATWLRHAAQRRCCGFGWIIRKRDIPEGDDANEALVEIDDGKPADFDVGHVRR